MTEKCITQNKLLVRRQLMNDIYELNLELAGLQDIIRMKRLLLKKINKEACASKANRYLKLVPDTDTVDSPKTGMCHCSESDFSEARHSISRGFKIIEGNGSSTKPC